MLPIFIVSLLIPRVEFFVSFLLDGQNDISIFFSFFFLFLGKSFSQLSDDDKLNFCIS